MGNWDNITEESLENFIKDNKDKFERFTPPGDEEKFLKKLLSRFKKVINIVPYLIRVAIAYTFIIIVSICIWNSCIRKDRHEITLKQKTYIIFKKAEVLIRHKHE